MRTALIRVEPNSMPRMALPDSIVCFAVKLIVVSLFVEVKGDKGR
jgi:hypothetical protein